MLDRGPLLRDVQGRRHRSALSPPRRRVLPGRLVAHLHAAEIAFNGHPNRNYLPGVETNTKALGCSGFPVATGIAIAGQLTGATYRTFVLTGDGEQQVCSNWEAAMVCGHRKLKNPTATVATARVPAKPSLDPLERYEALASTSPWSTAMIPPPCWQSSKAASQEKLRCVMIANTTKGKGVTMENVTSWQLHGVPNMAQYEQAMKELV